MNTTERVNKLVESIPEDVLEKFYARIMTGKTAKLREVIELNPILIEVARVDPYVARIAILEYRSSTIVYLNKELGVSIEKTDEMQRTPLHRLLESHHSQNRNVNITDGEKFRLKSEMLQTLIDLGVNVNAKDMYGLTPLLIAISKLRFSDLIENDFGKQLIKQLIDAKADPYLKSNLGLSALNLAFNHDKIINTSMKPIIDLLIGQLSFEDMAITQSLIG